MCRDGGTGVESEAMYPGPHAIAQSLVMLAARPSRQTHSLTFAFSSLIWCIVDLHARCMALHLGLTCGLAGLRQLCACATRLHVSGPTMQLSLSVLHWLLRLTIASGIRLAIHEACFRLADLELCRSGGTAGVLAHNSIVQQLSRAAVRRTRQPLCSQR